MFVSKQIPTRKKEQLIFKKEMDLFFAVIAKTNDKGTTLVTLEVDELKVLTGAETRNSY